MARMQGRVELQLERRQIAGIITGALLVLGLAFGLGVGFGRRLVQAPSSEASTASAAKLDDGAATAGLTYHQALTDTPAAPTAATPAPAPAAETKPVPKAEPVREATGRYCVQFDAFPSPQDANQKYVKLHDLGYAARVEPADIPGQGRVYRVRVGQYETRDQAEKLRSEAKLRHNLNSTTMPLP